MGCGNTKEFIAVEPAVDPKQQALEERWAREERARRYRDFKRQRVAAQRIADDAKKVAVDEITSRLGTLESYWVAGEFPSDNVKPHFIPTTGPTSLTERVPPAPASLREAILFAATPLSAASSSIDGAQPMPLPRHILPLFVGDDLLRDLALAGTLQQAARPENTDDSFATAGAGDALAPPDNNNSINTNININSITDIAIPTGPPEAVAATGAASASAEGNATPLRRGGPQSLPNPLSLTALRALSPAPASQHSAAFRPQQGPSLGQNCFLYPSQPFVARGYAEGPFGGRSAGWVRLPSGPIVRRRAKQHSPSGDTVDSSSPPHADAPQHQQQQQGGPNAPPLPQQPAAPQQAAPEQRGFLAPQKPYYDVRYDGPVDEPVGSHAYEVGEEADEDEEEEEAFAKYEGEVLEAARVHTAAVARYDAARAEAEAKAAGGNNARPPEAAAAAAPQQQQRPRREGEEVQAEANGAADEIYYGDSRAPEEGGTDSDADDNANANAPLPDHPPAPPPPPIVRVAVRQVAPRRLERYFLYPRELTAVGIQLEYRTAPGDVRTMGEARARLFAGQGAAPSSSAGCGPRAAHALQAPPPHPSPSPQLPRGTAAALPARTPTAIMTAIGRHLLPTAYSSPRPLGLAAFYQPAGGGYFGEDRPDGLAVRILRGAQPAPTIAGVGGKLGIAGDPTALPLSTTAGHAVPAAAAGGGAAAINNLHARGDDRPLKNCFVTFLTPNTSLPAQLSSHDASDSAAPSRLFSAAFMQEENSVPLHLFGDYGGFAMLCADPLGESSPPPPAAQGQPLPSPSIATPWWAAAHRYAEAFAFSQDLSAEAKALQRAVAEKVSRSEPADDEQRRLADVNAWLALYAAEMLAARNALAAKPIPNPNPTTATHSNTGGAVSASQPFCPSEDDIFWLHFRKELCALLARVLEQSLPTPPTGPQPVAVGRARAAQASAPPVVLDSAEVVGPKEAGAKDMATAAEAPKGSQRVDEGGPLTAFSTEDSAPSALGAASAGASVAVDVLAGNGGGAGAAAPRDPSSDDSYVLLSPDDAASAAQPNLPSHPPSAPSSAAPPQPAESPFELPDDAPVTCLQIRFGLHGQYNNTEFIAFNGNGRSNTAEGGDGEMPQLMTFRDTSRRPRVRQFAKPLAAGVATMVIPHCIPIPPAFAERIAIQQQRAEGGGAAEEDPCVVGKGRGGVEVSTAAGPQPQFVDCVTHLRYVASVLALVLDEFTSSVVVN